MSEYQFAIGAAFLGLAYLSGTDREDHIDMVLAVVWFVVGVLWIVGGFLGWGDA
jgi:hypothetical protein